MKKTSKLSRFFSFLWLRINPTNPKWDTLLNLLMDKAEVTSIDEHTITFDKDYKVWISNHPYSSGWYCKDSYDSRNSLCCSTKTAIRLEDFVNNLQKINTMFDSAIEYYKSK